MISTASLVPLVVLLFVFGLLIAALKILREYQRGVVFFLGRFQQTALIATPGLDVFFLCVDQLW